jgi:hypothetical protein
MRSYGQVSRPLTAFCLCALKISNSEIALPDNVWVRAAK